MLRFVLAFAVSLAAGVAFAQPVKIRPQAYGRDVHEMTPESAVSPPTLLQLHGRDPGFFSLYGIFSAPF